MERLINDQGQVWEWPCDRRDAHHPHIIEGVHDDFCEANGCRCGKCPCSCSQVYNCPGVKAHPQTQIGGNYKPDIDYLAQSVPGTAYFVKPPHTPAAVLMRDPKER